MINILIGNKNVKEFSTLCPKLTNDTNYRIKNFSTGVNTLIAYSKLKPDILILDSSLSADITIEDIISRISNNPIELKKCNTILTLQKNYCFRLKNVAKINTILYKPIINNELTEAIEKISNYYNIPDLEAYEVDYLLQTLNFNCMSAGYRYMRDAIIYCYYQPNKLEFLNTILIMLSSLYNVPVSKVRDSLNSTIRTFNNTVAFNNSNELYKFLYSNTNRISLKDFLEKVVFYLIKAKRKGQIF